MGIGLMNWNTRASAAGHKVSVTKSAPLAENAAWTFDVTEMMQAVGSGYGFNGFIISTTNTRDINIQGNMSAALDPVLEVEWTEAPLAPDQLAPSTGQACGTALPVLRWSFWDHAGATGMQSAQVQVAASEDGFGSPVWDSGSLPLTETQLDLASTSCPAPAVDTLRWWRVRNQDSAGLWSAWSDPVSWQWHPRLSVSLVQPEPEPVDVAGPELIVNGSFEDGLDGWSNGGGWQVNTPSPVDGAMKALRTGVGGALSQLVTLPHGAVSLTVTLRSWVDSGVTATVTVTPDVGSPTVVTLPTGSTWAPKVTVTAALSGATSALISIDGTGSTGSIRIDAVSARAVTTLAPSFTDPTPPIQWATSGDMPQARWRASVSVLEGSAWRVVAASGTVVSAETSWTPDVGLADAGTARIIVDVWDDRQREATPGTPIYSSVSGDFSFSPSDVIEIPRDIELTENRPLPSVMLSWTRSETPDRWDVYRDGKLLSRHDGLDWSTGGDSYQMVDKIAPNGEHTWTLYAIVNGVACKSQTITRTLRHSPTWLIDNEADERVCIVGDTDHDMTMPETVAEFSPIGGRRKVKVTTAQYGYEGTIDGDLVPVQGMPETETPQLWRERLLKWKADPGHALHLLIEDLSIPVQVTDISPRSLPGHPGSMFHFTIKWHQTGGWTFGSAS
ncbi:hypothetical protein DUY81_14060 [Acidipropionibacterium acidipropionici]|uniref:Uncharacterized protein n=1 Tax=Acidipropionibacterium acidipropionici TaxID=1748 RepID=A0AAC9AP58_9ACTN|nr:hypothetical protein AXH35_14310 [Acidipropionibacterium acidipropionici]AOZ47895.1 hypothetical protein A8L58_15770 [Acidipropionibacterium acidipropionici]AZP38760.1 hypothetical protein DUY81_14060 [Acidipropionibacterium acidipropionici]